MYSISMTKINNCICGSNRIDLHPSRFGNWMECLDCRKMTRFKDKMIDAIKEWNEGTEMGRKP